MGFIRKICSAMKLGASFAAALFAGLVSCSASAAVVAYSPSFAIGWNLAGNSLTTAIDVKNTFGAQVGIQTVWKWDAVNAKWAFYSPALDTAGTLNSYAASKGYSVLTTINQGEGYWVNALAQVSLPQASGTGFSLAASNLVSGWNLSATGDSIAPAAFTTTVGNVTTLWAWDNAHSAWYFYAPSLVASNTLASYISSKGYKDFGALTLDNGRGFWVNYVGTGAGGGTGGTGTGGGTTTGGTTNCLLTGSATSVNVLGGTIPLSYKYCYANLTAPFTCDAAGMGNSAAALDAIFRAYSSASVATWTYTSLASCSDAPAGTGVGNVLANPAYVGTGVVATLAGTGIPEASWASSTLADGAANVATFDFTDPWIHGLNKSNMVSDGTSLFVVDQGHYAIRKVDIATGAVSTLAGGRSGYGDGTGAAAFFLQPIGITIDAAKANLYVADYQFIRKIEIATGIVTTIAGMGGSYYNSTLQAYVPVNWFANATTSVAKDMLWHPQGITTVGTAMYLIDSVSGSADTPDGSGRVLKVDLSVTPATISTFATLSGYQDHGGNWAHAITTDGASLYIAGDGIVRKIDLATKAETVVAGSTGAAGMSAGIDGIGTAATFNSKNHGVAIDGNVLYVSDLSAVRKVDMSTGLVTTIAGSNIGGYADGTGVAAKFRELGGMTVVGGNLYVTDYSAIRRIQPDGATGTTPAAVSTTTNTSGPMAATTWSYTSPGGTAWASVTDATVPNGGTVFKAAAVGQNQSTIASMTVTLTKASTATFYRKVDSLACCDFLTFTVDGVEPANARWSGSVPWGQVSFPLTAGTHTLRWSYVKGVATYVNSTGALDTAWISQVTVADNPPVISGLVPTSGAIGTAVSILGSDLGNFPVSPTVNFSASAGVVTTSYPAPVPYAWGASNSSVGFSAPQDMPAGAYDVTLGSGATAPLSAGTFTIPVSGAQMGGARQGVPLNPGAGVTTLAGLATPKGATTDGTYLYATSGNKIYRIALATGEVSTVAGGGTPTIYGNSCNGVEGTGSAAAFCAPSGITTDGTNLFVTDTSDNSVRKVVIASGAATLINLPNQSALSLTGIGLFRPNAITTDGTYLYVAYYTNPVIIKIDIATGAATTLAGTGLNNLLDGTGTAASFKAPSSMTTDGTNLYLTDSATIRKIDPATRVVTTFAGSATVTGSTDGAGTLARFTAPGGITTDGTYLYVFDSGKIRRIEIATGVVTSLAASSVTPLTTDGTNLYGSAGNTISKIQTARASATVPTIVSATVNSASSVSLTWTKVAGAASYNVYRSTSPNVTIASANKANTTSTITAQEFTNTGLTSATTYYYKVTSVSTTNVESAGSAEIAVKTLVAPPAPTGLSATALGASKMDLSWTAVTGATSYNIYSSNSANVQIIAANAKGSSATTTAQLTNLSASVKYYYKVTAVSATGESLGSTEVSATTGAYPAAATGLTATAVSGTQIDLSWNAVAGAVSYNVYLGSDTTLKGNTTQTTFSVTGLSIGTLYNNFFVRAVNAAGEQSLVSPMAVSATTLSLPTPPAGASATPVSGTQINLAWTSKAGETYNVYRSATGYPTVIASNKITATPVTSGAYSDTAGLTAGATYYYKITAINSIGEQLNGTAVFATTIPSITAAPAGVAATLNGTSQINISWSTVTGAASFNIYRSTASNVQIIAANKVGSVSALSFANTGLATGTSYYYKVTAVNAGGESIASSEVTATTPSAPAAPSVTATAVSPTQINLSWPSVTGATGYNVYSSTAAGVVTTNTTNLISSAYPPMTATSLWDSGLTVGTTYYYKVTGVNAVGEGIASAEMSVTTPAATTTPAVGTQMGGARQGVALSLAGTVTTFAGSGAGGALDGIGKMATMDSLASLTSDGVNVYVAEANGQTIRKIVIATGQVTTLAGASGLSGATDAVGAAARFNHPSGITISGNTLFVTDQYNYKIRKIDIPTGAVTTMTLTDSMSATYPYPGYMGITTDGTNLYVADGTYGLIRKIDIATGMSTILAGGGSGTSTNATGTAASFYGPKAITTDGTNLYVADTFNNKIRKIVISSGAVTTLAGTGGYGAVDSATGATSSFYLPLGITTDGTSLYVTEQNNYKVRKVDIATTAVSTLVGSTTAGNVDGTGASAKLSSVYGIVTDGNKLYVAANIKIRKIE